MVVGTGVGVGVGVEAGVVVRVAKEEEGGVERAGRAPTISTVSLHQGPLARSMGNLSTRVQAPCKSVRQDTEPLPFRPLFPTSTSDA